MNKPVITKNRLTQVYTKEQASLDSRRQLLSTFNGVLSTLMRDTLDIEGYPFGSVLPYCLNQQGEIILLISDLAQHTRNLIQNPKASFLIHNNDQDNIQKGWRLTVIGDVIPVADDEYDAVAYRYNLLYPESQDYYEVHDFNFYKLIPIKYRYINGFGEIHWVDKDRVIEPSPFNADLEQSMIAHMNNDHYDALVRFIKTKMPLKKEPIRMTSIDQYGFVVAMGEAIFRFFFETEASTPNDIREKLVKMTKEVA